MKSPSQILEDINLIKNADSADVLLILKNSDFTDDLVFSFLQKVARETPEESQDQESSELGSDELLNRYNFDMNDLDIIEYLVESLKITDK